MRFCFRKIPRAHSAAWRISVGCDETSNAGGSGAAAAAGDERRHPPSDSSIVAKKIFRVRGRSTLSVQRYSVQRPLQRRVRRLPAPRRHGFRR